jgi:ABC-2 type transport system permease protein
VIRPARSRLLPFADILLPAAEPAFHRQQALVAAAAGVPAAAAGDGRAPHRQPAAAQYLAHAPAGLRADLTATQEYSLSQTTYDLVGNLQEPLLIRGYISERTHPLLAPLTPRIADMLREYEIAGRGMITAEVVDPITDPELENEANQLYGIQPRPYQIADRYESTVINSYFNILLQYGDQTVVLGFDDLVQTTTSPDGSVDVQLSNLEYDLTRGIKRVLYGFQSIDAVLAALDEPVELTLFITPESLPEWMSSAEETITAVARAIEADAGGKFQLHRCQP